MPDSSLPAQWIHGSESSKHNTDPDIQVHWYDDDTAILRQNKAIHYEAPFLYLLFGADRAVLLDTGATSSPALFPLRSVVDTLIGDWLRRRGIRDHHLLVLHTHSHDDHVAGDAQFLDRPDTTVVGADRDSAWRFLGFTEDDSESVRDLELGGRRVEVLATPGHDAAALTFYDPGTGLLLTGDTVYRGRLYIDDWQRFSRTIDRLVEFAERRPVTHVLGCHIEMTRTPGVDYPVRTTFQPDEPPLEMTPAHLRAVQAALAEAGPTPVLRRHEDFILWPED
jgi:glyoxylase-like metal-dependent hydrolase (beta-lactamase superfamily II)